MRFVKDANSNHTSIILAQLRSTCFRGRPRKGETPFVMINHGVLSDASSNRYTDDASTPKLKGTNSKGRIAKWLKQRVHIPTSWVRIPLQMVPCLYQQRCPQQHQDGFESDPMQESGRRSNGGLGPVVYQASCERHQQQFIGNIYDCKSCYVGSNP